MRTPRRISFLATLAVLGSVGLPARAEEPKGKPAVECKLTYSLSGWSAFYKTAKGDGKVVCDNGQSADVTMQSKGGGITFGKTAVYDGHGTFSKVHDISEVFGGYAAAEAHAGASKSASAQALTKGEVSLALAGTGQGVDLGIAFSKLTIKKK